MIAISKLVIAVCAVFYMVITYVLMFNNKLKEKQLFHEFNYLNIITIHVVGFIVMYKNTRQNFFILFLFISLAIQLGYRIIMSFIYKKHSRLLLNNMCFFYTTGLIVIARLSHAKAMRQLVFLTLAFLISLIIPAIIRYFKFLHKLNLLFAFLSISTLALLYIKGNSVNGAIITFKIGPYVFQPTEFIKIIIIFFIASLLATKINTIRMCYSGIIVMICTCFLILSKDLGSAAIFLIVYFSMLYKATGRIRIITAGFVLGVAGCIVAFILFSHLRTRVNIWINPWNDIEGSGYQIVQSLFSISMGGFFGTGLTEGMPGLIPFVESDMIFSAIVEEMGAIFGCALILIFLSCFFEFINISNRLTDKFYSYLSYGLGISLIFQTFLTIGGSIKYIPLTGVTLPFISYGGSSLIATGALFGIAHGLNIVMHKEAVSEEEIDNKQLVNNEDNEVVSQTSKHTFLIRLVFSVLYIGMIVHIASFLIFESSNVIKNEYNVARIEKLSKRYIRGNILSRDGEILARTLNTANYSRVYPYGEVFAHTVGNLYNGKSGVESLSNIALSYKKLTLFQEIKNELNKTRSYTNDIVTTLDFDMQMAAYNAINGYKGAIIALNPKTGEILAMVSSPSYDPNDIANVYYMMQEDSKDSVFLNRATLGLYTPGSTFKIFTALEYIRQNKDNYNDFIYECSGIYQYDKYELQCYHKKAHGTETLINAFANSCNCAFGHIGQQLDKESFKNTLSDLLFSKNIPCPFPASKSYVSINKDTSGKQMVQIGIGQSDTLITPMHLALITCAIANDGVLMEPSIIIKDDYAKKQFSLLKPEEADILCQMMQAVVSDGTASSMSSLYMAAGKTGTAEFKSNSSESHAWFTGFAPFDDPEIVVTVILEGAGTGSKYAVPIAEMLIDTYYSNQNIE